MLISQKYFSAPPHMNSDLPLIKRSFKNSYSAKEKRENSPQNTASLPFSKNYRENPFLKVNFSKNLFRPGTQGFCLPLNQTFV